MRRQAKNLRQGNKSARHFLRTIYKATKFIPSIIDYQRKDILFNGLNKKIAVQLKFNTKPEDDYNTVYQAAIRIGNTLDGPSLFNEEEENLQLFEAFKNGRNMVIKKDKIQGTYCTFCKNNTHNTKDCRSRNNPNNQNNRSNNKNNNNRNNRKGKYCTVCKMSNHNTADWQSQTRRSSATQTIKPTTK